MKNLLNIEVSYDKACMKSLRKLPDSVSADFIAMTAKIMADPSRNGLNVEPIEGARDKSIKSVRLDRGYRAIGSLQGQDMLFLHVNEHDKAYRWATNRQVTFDRAMNRVRIIEVVEETVEEAKTARHERQAGLFDAFEDEVLRQLGVPDAEFRRVRGIVNEAGLNAEEPELDPTTYDILCALQMGFKLDEIPKLLGEEPAETSGATKADPTFADAIRTPESRSTIFIPSDQEELRRVLEGDMDGWRVFLHPDQRKFAYRDYNGPALVRGGAGTGKTVVAMHRAKFIADQIARTPSREGEKVLVTTFTTNLARDIEANLKTLCPEHFERGKAVIEVQNLDAWVGDFLRRRSFDRDVVYFDGDQRVSDIWDEILDRAEFPEGLSADFIRNEWAEVIQAKGVEDKRSYFKVSRAGRGTPLDRRKRAALWPIFESFRARMLAAGLAEPDDAYREAITLLSRDGSTLPYSSVIVDEAQDMGEQAFKLVRSIVPPASSGDQNSIFIVGDAHQRIYARRASLAACGVNVRGRARRLRLNYRTTEDIRRWAVAVLEGVEVDDLDEDRDTLKGYHSLMSGPSPTMRGYPDRKTELAALVEELSRLLDSAAHREVGILARSKKCLDDIEAALVAAGIDVRRLQNNTPDDPAAPGVRLCTMHRAKGLEFRMVFMTCVDDGLVPPAPALRQAVDPAARREVLEREKSLIHVAATRAKEQLYVSWSGSPSQVLPQPSAGSVRQAAE